MAYGDTTILTGASGKQYQFSIFPRSTTFQAKPGVYVMGRPAGVDRYEFCFVGETADLSSARSARTSRRASIDLASTRYS